MLKANTCGESNHADTGLQLMATHTPTCTLPGFLQSGMTMLSHWTQRKQLGSIHDCSTSGMELDRLGIYPASFHDSSEGRGFFQMILSNDS